MEIGVRELAEIFCGAHAHIKVLDLEQEKVTIRCDVGNIVITGKVEEVVIENHVGRIDASGLQADRGKVKIDSWGTVVADVIGNLEKDISDSGKFSLVKEGGTDSLQDAVDPSIRYSDFKIKNNSWKRHAFYVVGPKPDGTSFSYGFSLWPGQKRSERWTIGTQVYRESGHGNHRLLVTIDSDDEGEVVDLWNKE